jgi:hypothetical protein
VAVESIVNEDDVVRIVRSYIEGLFPKVCSGCGKRFGSLREYLQSTSHVGTPIVYEAISGETLAAPLGPIAHANCACGNTLTIGSEGMPPGQMIVLMEWAKSECNKRSMSIRDLLLHLRDRIDAEVFRNEENGRD